jgi:hypothetical protein
MVLNANEIIVAIDTPLERVRVSNTSAGMIQDRGPQVAEKEKLYSQVIMMKPQWAPVLLVDGGNLASRAVAIMNVTQLPRLPEIRVQRRPKRSMKRMQRNWATRAMMELMAW